MEEVNPATHTETEPQAVEDQPNDQSAAICPYLGRRQHPDLVHPFATSRNVCFAVTRPKSRPYRTLHKITQLDMCLQGRAGWEACRHYRKALAAGVPSPREVPADQGYLVRVRTRKGLWRHVRRMAVHVLDRLEFILLILIFCVFLALLAYFALWATSGISR
ncbi:MAG: hypothetical protein QHJ73_12760 [Armatimonadota bacterium]|nr:hypothetical protein [Armatimonadota bacterium]